VYLARQGGLDYQIARAGWIGDYADPNTFLELWVTGGGNNQTGWSSKWYDDLIGQAACKLVNAKDRMRALQQAERLLLEEAPILPLFTSSA
jgi:oligopeptide transport system substrate-binding protein